MIPETAAATNNNFSASFVNLLARSALDYTSFGGLFGYTRQSKIKTTTLTAYLAILGRAKS